MKLSAALVYVIYSVVRHVVLAAIKPSEQEYCQKVLITFPWFKFNTTTDGPVSSDLQD